MLCPVCRSEFVEGMAVCAADGVDLVEVLPPPPRVWRSRARSVARAWEESGWGPRLADVLWRAGIVGLLVQGAVAVATLRFWLVHHMSFYLAYPGHWYPGTYLVQLVLWPVGVVLFAFGFKRSALGAAVAAGALSVMNAWFNSGLGGHAPPGLVDLPSTSLVLAMTLLGVLPVLTLLFTHRRPAGLPRPLMSVGVLALLALSLSLTSDGYGLGPIMGSGGGFEPYPFRLHNTLVPAAISVWLVAVFVGAAYTKWTPSRHVGSAAVQ